MEPISVVVVDSHQLIRAGFSLIFQAQSDLQVIGEGETAAEAVDLVRTRQPQVLCISAKFDDDSTSASGLAAVEAIRALPGIRQPRILLLVGSRDGDVSTAARTAGADAVLPKYATPEAIVMALRAVTTVR